MDFVAARLFDGRWFRVLTVVDQFTRECLLLLADSSLSGQKVALALSVVIAERGAPVSITVDNELSKKAMARNEHTSAVARRASNAGYDSRDSRRRRCIGPVACVSAHRQGFARTARRLTPPLTGAATAAEWAISGS